MGKLMKEGATRVEGVYGRRTGEAKEANGSRAGEVRKTLFAPPEEKLFFGDADLDEPLAFVGAGKSALEETEINGVKCFAGEVGFVRPGSYWSLLNPFTKASDEEGNTYWVRGLVGLCIVIEAAKRKEKLKVVCLKTGAKEYEVVRW